MSIIFDLVIVLIMVATVLSAYKKGFVASLLSLLSAIVSVIATFVFYKPVAQFLDKTVISGKTTELIRDKISALASNGNLESLLNDMPQNFKDFLSNFDISPEGIQQAFSESDMSANKFADSLAQRLADDISYIISCAIAIIGIFVIASIVCAIVSYFVNSIFKLPVLNFANKALGIVMGVLCALIVGWILCISSSMIFNVLGSIYPESVNKELIKDSFLINLFSSVDLISIIKK